MGISNAARLNRTAKVAILVVIVLASILAIQYLKAPPSAPTDIIVGISGIGNAYWLMYIGVDAGIFQKCDLNVTLVVLGSGRDMMTALVAGQIQISVMTPFTAIPAKLEGLDVVQVAATEDVRPLYLVANSKINSLEQLEGKVGGVGQIGTGLYYYAMVIMLRQLGLDPEKDVTLVPIQSTSVMLTAVQTGKADFALTPDPVKAKKLGLNVLLFLSDKIKGLPGNGYGTTTRYLQENKEIVKKFVMSLTEATKFFLEKKEESKKILSKWIEENDPETLEQHYQDCSKVARKIPMADLEQVRRALEELAASEPKAVNADPKQFIDNFIVEELESEGFFRSIWGT